MRLRFVYGDNVFVLRGLANAGRGEQTDAAGYSESDALVRAGQIFLSFA